MTSPLVFILPKETSPDARIVTLPDPRTSAPRRYYFCPDKGIYEFTKIAAPKSNPRSWLLAPSRPPVVEAANGTLSTTEDTTKVENGSQSESDISNGYVSSDADLFIATPLDPLFLLLPALAPRPSSAKANDDSPKRLFQSLDDHLESLVSSHLAHLTRHEPTQKRLERRMAAVCDAVDAGDEKMYRLNEQRLLEQLLNKARRMASAGLPPSLEEKYVRRVLDVPILSISREESSLSSEIPAVAAAPEDNDDPPTESTTPATESTTDSTTTSFASTSASSAAETPASSTSSPSSPLPTPEIHSLLRIRTALNYLLSAYVPAHLHASLAALLSHPTSSIDLTPLDSHLSHLKQLRHDALSSRSLTDFTRKRGMDDADYEAAEAGRAEKRRRKEEEERRRKGESRAMRDLKKVDTKGMRKMSDFFGRKGGK